MSERKQIIIYLIATRKYHVFVQPLIDSIERYFLNNHFVTILLFTDSDTKYHHSQKQLVYIKIPSYKYPEVTLLRYKFVTENKEFFENFDAIYYLDADMLIVAQITEAILPDERGLVAVVHPGFFAGGFGSHGTHERSLAYMQPEKRTQYFCGGTQGGATKEYLAMAKEISENIEKDYETAREIGYTQNNGILAEYNDESFFNEYLSRHPFKTLDSSYCYPHWEIPFDKKILALEKNHSEIRS